MGDHYIADTVSGFLKQDVAPETDSLIADILGGDNTLSGAAGGRVIYCTDCTQEGGDYLYETYYGDDDDA